MTRFEKELNGLLGEYWQKDAEKEMARAVEMADRDAIVDENGAIRWRKNGNYLMDDLCEKLEYAGYNFSRKATAIARDKQTDEFLTEYREQMKNHKYTDEELCEMRNAFGKGTVIVDCITGRRIHL